MHSHAALLQPLAYLNAPFHAPLSASLLFLHRPTASGALSLGALDVGAVLPRIAPTSQQFMFVLLMPANTLHDGGICCHVSSFDSAVRNPAAWQMNIEPLLDHTKQPI